MVAKLFLQRTMQNFRFQVSAWKLGLDWTVVVYILMPTLYVSLAVYRTWWIDLPLWMSKLPFTGFLLVSYVILWLGSLRLFIEEADQLFLLQKRSAYLLLRWLGIGYSLVKSTVFVGIYFVIFLPYLVEQFFEVSHLFRILLIFSLWKAVFLLLKQLLLSLNRFVRLTIFIASFLFGMPLFLESIMYLQTTFFIPIVISLFILAIFLSRLKARRIGYFYEELENEWEVKNRVASLLLIQSGTVEKRRSKQRRYPWIFRRSNRWFKHRGFDQIVIEHYIKSWLRKPEKIFLYVRTLIFSIISLLLFPGGWNVIVLIMLFFLFYQLIKSEWEEFVRSPFVQMIVRDEHRLLFVKKRVLSLFIMPAYVIFILVHGMVVKSVFTFVIFSVFLLMALNPWLKRFPT